MVAVCCPIILLFYKSGFCNIDDHYWNDNWYSKNHRGAWILVQNDQLLEIHLASPALQPSRTFGVSCQPEVEFEKLPTYLSSKTFSQIDWGQPLSSFELLSGCLAVSHQSTKSLAPGSLTAPRPQRGRLRDQIARQPPRNRGRTVPIGNWRPEVLNATGERGRNWGKERGRLRIR